MSKYDALGTFLKGQKAAHVPMTFREIERVTGAKLPNSKQYAAWWSNNTFNNVMTKIWLEAGFRTEQIDIKAERLVFRRVAPEAPGLKETAKMFEPAPSSVRHPIFGALKGTFTIQPGWSLESPALEEKDLRDIETGLEKTAGLIEQGFSSGRG
jgi:hypothetical protein